MKVRVVVKDDGTVSFDYEGFRGKVCLEDFERLLKKLEECGIELELVRRMLKEEVWERETRTVGVEGEET